MGGIFCTWRGGWGLASEPLNNPTRIWTINSIRSIAVPVYEGFMPSPGLAMASRIDVSDWMFLSL
jgi:hypothetical protein